MLAYLKQLNTSHISSTCAFLTMTSQNVCCEKRASCSKEIQHQQRDVLYNPDIQVGS